MSLLSIATDSRSRLFHWETPSRFYFIEEVRLQGVETLLRKPWTSKQGVLQIRQQRQSIIKLRFDVLAAESTSLSDGVFS